MAPSLLRGHFYTIPPCLPTQNPDEPIFLSLNHGGRQLDGTVSPLRVLRLVAAEAGDMTVMMDSGIRRGTDVLKAMALGAKFVFVGRPFNYAASIAGEAGALHAAEILRGEVYRNMALLGVNSFSELGPERLMRIKG